ncbi:MAG: MarR family transcriptional regulator [Micrococcales bacterium]|nr:MarR family transcriptional regulator [Micrococcales bacterium]
MTLTRSELHHLSTDLRLACMRISRRVRFESSDEIAPHHFSVLCRLEESPRTPRELASIERVSAPSMSRTTAGLCELGLVSRADDPDDGRSVILTITPDGKELLARTRRQRNQWMTERIRGLSEQEQQTLAAAAVILERVAAE